MKIRPAGYGLKVSPLSDQAESRCLIEVHVRWVTNHTVPSGTDVDIPGPRHFMPGYLHIVPPGQRRRLFKSFVAAMSSSTLPARDFCGPGARPYHAGGISTNSNLGRTRRQRVSKRHRPAPRA
jgi:hypothetical protein